MCYFAEFNQSPHGDIRIDTRVYLDDISPAPNDLPIAAIIAKNPGSAQPNPQHGYGKLAPLLLSKDQMLPTVRSVFRQARNMAIQRGQKPQGIYVQVLNLSYYCTPDLDALQKIVRQHGPGPRCPRESLAFPVVWYGWGWDNKTLDPLKTRFESCSVGSHAIYYDYSIKQVVVSRNCPAPSHATYVKHPQGMPHHPFISELAKLL